MKLIIVLTYILLIFISYRLILLNKELHRLKDVMKEHGLDSKPAKENKTAIQLDNDILSQIEFKDQTKKYELDETIPDANEKLKEIEENQYAYIHDMEKVLNEAVSIISLTMKYPPELDRTDRRYYYVFYKDNLLKQSIGVLGIKVSSEKQIDKDDREVFYKEFKFILEKKGYEVVYDIKDLGKSLIYIN